MQNKTSSKDYALNVQLDDSTAERMIQLVQDDSTVLAVSISEKKPYLDQAVFNLEEIKKEYNQKIAEAQVEVNKWGTEIDQLTKKMESNKRWYQVLVAYCKHEKPDKHLRLMRQTSILDKGLKPKKTYSHRIDWKTIITEVLTTHNRFVSADTLLEITAKKYPEVQATKETRTKLVNNLDNSHYSGSYMFKFKNRYGLREWSENNLPKPEYLAGWNDFMQGNNEQVREKHLRRVI
jgi:hypothetical protein